ncbi:MAG: lipase family protein, partial [Pyrinomonadaceae bacterium]
MTTRLDYALMAANVYSALDTVRSEQNTIPLSEGWQIAKWADGQDISSVNRGTGFMARAYQNGNEIVISYCGTTDENGLDWLRGNIPAAIGAPLAAQIRDAAKFYLDVKRANPNAVISFTGHSLGGGLASLMSVYFNHDATVFDPAPFEKSADSTTVINTLRSSLLELGYTTDELVAFNDYVGGGPEGVIDSPTREAREGRIHMVNVTGEALSLLSDPAMQAVAATLGLFPGVIGFELFQLGSGVGRFFGSAEWLDPNAASGNGWHFKPFGIPLPVNGNPVDLHSIALLTAFVQSGDLLQASQASPELLQTIFTSRLSKFENFSTDRQFFNLMVQRETVEEGALSAFAGDVRKIDGGLVAAEGVKFALLKTLIAAHYAQGMDRVD